MDIFLAWCSFFGSWLLVAGSIYQSALELKDEDIERDRIRATGEKVGPRPKVSVWWWLIPPLKILFESRNNKAYQHKYFMAMTDEDAEAMMSFTNKAGAWIFVALGGFLLAVDETSNIIHPHHLWGFIGYAGLVLLLLFLCVINTVVRIKNSNNMIRLNHETESE